MRAELERLLHQTLRSMGIAEGDVHMIIEWIADDDDALRKEHAEELDELRRVWMLRAAGMAMIGVTIGAVSAVALCVTFAP